MNDTFPPLNSKEFSQLIKNWGEEVGFNQVGITDTDLSAYEGHFLDWIARDYHGEMAYMAKHGTKRTRPATLIPGTQRIIMVRLDYLPPAFDSLRVLSNPNLGMVSRYALGRDYHKIIRKRLTKFAKKIEENIGPYNYRAFADSGPVLEKALAERAGLGWIGKHTILINSKAGSWFFLGTLYTDLPLVIDQPSGNRHCGSCRACIDICPTQAIVAPGKLDARKCISYLTIELKGAIPLEFRAKIGNRIFGCDDCQLICPWNKFAKITQETAFHPRHELEAPKLLELFNWSETEFVQKTEGSAIRRATYPGWLRNIAVALGNAPHSIEIIQALEAKKSFPNEIVQEHVAWAIAQQKSKCK